MFENLQDTSFGPFTFLLNLFSQCVSMYADKTTIYMSVKKKHTQSTAK